MTANILTSDQVDFPNPTTPDIAISVRNVSKMFSLYAGPRDRLKQLLWYALSKFFTEEVAR